MKNIKFAVTCLILLSGCSKPASDPIIEVVPVQQPEQAQKPKEEFTITVLESPSKEAVPAATPIQVAPTPEVELPQVAQTAPSATSTKPAAEDTSQRKLLESLKKENEKLLKLLAEKEAMKNQDQSIQKLKDSAPSKKSYFVMVGSFKSVSAYEKLTSNIKSNNFPVVTTQKTVGEDTIKSVKVGPFESKEQATATLQKLLEDSSFPKDAFVK